MAKNGTGFNKTYIEKGAFRGRSFGMLSWISVLYLQMLPRAPLLLKYTMQDSTGKEEVAARGFFCSL